MMVAAADPNANRIARLAGVAYLFIIGCGLFSELYVRSTLIARGDAALTAQQIAGSMGLFRAGIVSDLVMVVADVVLAVLLYRLLRPVHATVSLMTAAFRLIQAAILGMNLLNLLAVTLLRDSAIAADRQAALGLLFLDVHRYGYDLGLVFFGISCALLGWLLYRSGFVPRVLGVLMGFASLSYLVGSFTLFLAPARAESIGAIYGVAALAEISLCLWLLIRGVRSGPGNR